MPNSLWRLVTVVLLFGLIPAGPVAAIDPPVESNANEITAMILQLQAESRDKRKAALKKLIEIGKPAAVSLVKALSDPSQEKRAAVAGALRELLARRPDARPNDQGRAYWQNRAD